MRTVRVLVVLLVAVILSGCSTAWQYQRSGKQTTLSQPTPNGGTEETRSFVENGQGYGFDPQQGSFQNYYQPPQYYRAPIQRVEPRYQYQFNQFNDSPVIVPSAPSAAALRGMLPR